jgi:hypothetical protein
MSSRWLFRQGELILGPLDQEQLAQRILEGELGDDTEARELEGEVFRPLCEIEAFAVALAKAKAKQRVDVLSEKRAVAKRKRLLKTLVAVLSLLVLGSAAAYVVGQEWARKKPTTPTDSLAFAGFSSEVPTIRRSPKGASENTTLLSYRDSTPSSGSSGPSGQRTGKSGRRSTWVDDVTTDIQWNPDSIKQVLNSNERRLLNCLHSNVKAAHGWSPGESVTIPLEFTIANNGRVNKLWVSHPRYKGKELESCLQQEMEKWPFAPYDGDQAVVAWSLSWKVRG